MPPKKSPNQRNSKGEKTPTSSDAPSNLRSPSRERCETPKKSSPPQKTAMEILLAPLSSTPSQTTPTSPSQQISEVVGEAASSAGKKPSPFMRAIGKLSGSNENLRSAEKEERTAIEGEKRADLVTTWMAKVLEYGVDALIREYKDIPNEAPPEKSSVFRQNPTKNRFPDIPCCDQTRVALKSDPSFYIHANYVGSGEIKNRFICTQAPTPTTIIDFWKMIVACRIEYIVMLCDVKENGKVKSADYFPVKSGEIVHVGKLYMVTKQDTVEIDSGITMTTFRIVKNDGGDQTFVKHIHWKSWPDHGVPTNYMAPFKIIAAFRKSVSPVVVHCSAGVGRTGTFVLIAAIYENLRSESFVGAAALLTKMRLERFKCIQGEVQYLYVHRCFVEYLTSKKYAISKLHSAKFRAEYDVISSKPHPLW